MENPTAGKTALGMDIGIGVLISYFGNLACGLPLGLIFCILVIVQDKVNKVSHFHAFQSIFVGVAAVVLAIPLGIVFFVGGMIDMAIGLPIVTGIFGLAVLVISLALLYFVIMAAVKGYGGQIYKIPVIGNFADKYSS